MDPSRPEQTSDSKFVIHIQADQGFIELMQQLICIFRQDLHGEDLQTATRWVEKIAGKSVVDGVWENEHEDAFVRGQERFFWEGNATRGRLASSFASIKAAYREAYPTLARSPIDVELTEEMRDVFRRLFGV
jgi:hypothetical protein